MAAGNEEVTLFNLAPRLASKLAQPGFLQAFKAANTPNRDGYVSIGQQLERNAAENPHGTAIKFYGQSWSWAQLNTWANRWAAYLAGRGVGQGDAVVINISNRPETVVAMSAVTKLGAIAAMINTSQTGDVLAHSLTLVKPKLLLIGNEQLEAMQTVPELLAGDLKGKLVFVPETDSDDTPADWDDIVAASQSASSINPISVGQIQGKQPCFYIFTSGTTGMPKASVMSHDRWIRVGTAMGRIAMDASKDDTFYCCLPLYHNNALTLAVGTCFVTGSTLALSRRFSASKFWSEVRDYDATLFIYIGELLRYLMNQPAQANDTDNGIRAILGNGLRPDIWDQFKARFGIERVHEFYGASESNSGFINVFNFDKTIGFCNPKNYALVKYDIDEDEPVKDSKGRLIKVGRGETGLCISPVTEKLPFDGYTDSAASEKKMMRNVFKQGDCWFNTGDLLMDIGLGHARFVDRVGDTFRWQGENVATTEVEAAVIKWHQTEDAVVYGVQVPGRDGRVGMLSYTLKAGETLDAGGMAAHLQNTLPKYAVPRFMRVQQQQAVTGTFKHQKAKLKAEGYDPAKVTEQLYFLEPGSQQWVELTPDLKISVDDGSKRL